MASKDFLHIVDVSARDGLQNEPKIVAVEQKIDLINRLSHTGLTHIEVGSFVSPKWVPQMADTAAVFAGIDHRPGIRYSTLVPNQKGMEQAVAAGVKTIAVFIAASETFSQKNINCSIAESFERLVPVFAMAKAEKIDVRGYVSCVMGCPFEGDIAPSKVAQVSKQLFDLGAYEISLGDTIGVGTMDKIHAMLDAVIPVVPVGNLAIHCHDTYGRAIENIAAAYERGIRVADAAVGGLGGCPYAKRADDDPHLPRGNVATEKLLDYCAADGIETGIDRTHMLAIGIFAKGLVA